MANCCRWTRFARQSTTCGHSTSWLRRLLHTSSHWYPSAMTCWESKILRGPRPSAIRRGLPPQAQPITHGQGIGAPAHHLRGWQAAWPLQNHHQQLHIHVAAHPAGLDSHNEAAPRLAVHHMYSICKSQCNSLHARHQLTHVHVWGTGNSPHTNHNTCNLTRIYYSATPFSRSHRRRCLRSP